VRRRVGIVVAAALVALVAVVADAGPRRCRVACRDAVAACVENGSRKAKCKKSLRRACRREGVLACHVTSTTTTILTTTTLPGPERWCFDAPTRTRCSAAPFSSCPSSPSGSFDLDIDGANVTGTWNGDAYGRADYPVSGTNGDDVLDFAATGCTVSFPGGECNGYQWQWRWVARGTGDVRSLNLYAYSWSTPSSLMGFSADYEGTLSRCEPP
jgi:hypothetical protein